MPKVTIGIPAFKAAHLGQAIASVLAQTYDDFELLISDDCPGDSVMEVVSHFDDPRLRVIQGPRRGLIPNSVHVWENATCDLLKFLYDDDFLLPFCLRDLVELIETDPSLTFAFSARHRVDAIGRILESPQPIASGKAEKVPGGVIADVLIGTLRNPIGEPSNLLIRRSAFADAGCLGGYGGVAVRHHVDVAFFLNAAERGPCAGTPAFGSAFRRHPDQVTSQQTAPDFSYGLSEWEMFLRAGISRGLVKPEVGLRSFDRLGHIYATYVNGYPELRAMAEGLPALRERLEAQDRDLLTPEFLARLASVEAAIRARKELR